MATIFRCQRKLSVIVSVAFYDTYCHSRWHLWGLAEFSSIGTFHAECCWTFAQIFNVLTVYYVASALSHTHRTPPLVMRSRRGQEAELEMSLLPMQTRDQARQLASCCRTGLRCPTTTSRCRASSTGSVR